MAAGQPTPLQLKLARNLGRGPTYPQNRTFLVAPFSPGCADFVEKLDAERPLVAPEF